MNLISLAINRPTAVIAAVLITVLFGVLALNAIPIQLAPDVTRPVIDIRTSWVGAAPAEVEREILVPQEDQLKGVSGVERITGRALQGEARVRIEFTVGTDMDKSLLLVSNRLDGVVGYPEEADEPRFKIAGPEDNRIAWFRLARIEGNTTPVHHFGDFADDVIRDRIERVPGVSTVNIYGGGEREIQIVIDPAQISRYGLTVTEVLEHLRAANISTTGGDVEEGKRRYVVRTEGELNTLDAIRSVVLRSSGAAAGTAAKIGHVQVGDIATVQYGYKTPSARVRTNGEPTLAINATREVGANVINTMSGIREAVAELNAGPIAREGLHMTQLYDETTYINSAIDLVIQNIWVGGVIAVMILLLFLRSARATFVVGLAIPVSVVSAFVAMALLGRSINVVSLAGIAFATGMVVDAAIVVLENIYRLRQQGREASVAALLGTKQVWGAILVSALTTVVVFIPILVMELEVGQLFRDIAVAISVAVVMSLLVSITVIPSLSRRVLSGTVPSLGDRVKIPGIDEFARRFSDGVVTAVTAMARSRTVALSIVGAAVAIALGISALLLPPLEYLPAGNRNLVINAVFPPPGYNLKTMDHIAEKIETAVLPHLSPEGEISPPDQPPKIQRFFFVVWRNQTFFGASSTESSRASEMVPLLSRLARQEPGTFVYSYQPSIFGRGIGGSRSVDLDISGAGLEEIFGVAQRAAQKVLSILPPNEGNSFRPRPSLSLGEPEIRIIPDRVRLSDAGISARELALSVDAFNDGIRIAEVTEGGNQIDLVLKGPEDNVGETQGISALPVLTRSGTVLPVSSLADVGVTVGPTEIRHVERFRTVTLQIRPQPLIALGDALDLLQTEVIDSLGAEGLPPGVRMRLSGTADKLVVTANEIKWNLVVALIIVYLVMAVLFESFVYPLIIVLSVPLATAGGVLGLTVLNFFQFQALDMLTLLGFVILIGIVVNNAILIVHQTLHHIREEGMDHTKAVVEATRNRIRPIFMSTLTSIGGMLPLVLFPGAGSEIYRGLGSVVVGGLGLSALLTLALVPALLTVFVGVMEDRKVAGHRKAATLAGE